MNRPRTCALLLLSLSAVYLLRRRGQRWGATCAEADGVLPGDSIVPHPTLETTHASTIDASPGEVWPWIVQMGYYRAGWYTDPDWWDYWPDRYLRWVSRKEAEKTGHAHRDAPSAVTILSEFQNLAAGDVILDGPPGTAYFTVAALEPNRLLALYSTTHLRFLFPEAVRENPRFGIAGEFSWAFVLRETEGGKTRLILRTRGNAAPSLYRYFVAAFLPLADWALARKMLRGIKRRAERQDRRTQ